MRVNFIRPTGRSLDAEIDSSNELSITVASHRDQPPRTFYPTKDEAAQIAELLSQWVKT